jgi:RNA polymerase sigma factor (sigma-70 family)
MLSTLVGNSNEKEPGWLSQFDRGRHFSNEGRFDVSDTTAAGTSDRQLLTSLRSGSSTDFHELYLRHASAVLRYAWRLADDSSDAEDLVQEVFATAWAKRRTITIAGDSLLPWLLVTCRNHGANLVRKKSRTRTVPIADDETTSATSNDGNDLRWIRHEIDSLSPTDQRICQLCLLEGVPYREAAEQLGFTANGVAKRVERIRKHLRSVRTGD